MVLRHLAAIFIFSGPLFYIGLLMAVDPAGIPTLSQWLLRVFKTSCIAWLDFLRKTSLNPTTPRFPERCGEL